MKFPKLIFRRGVPLISADKKAIGRVPTSVARELVTSNHATVLRNNPAIIGLQPPTKSRNADVPRAVNNPLKQLIATASIFAAAGRRVPALNSLLFNVDREKLTVSATNLESYFSGSIASGGKYTFTHDEGINEICINAQQLKKILACPDECSNIQLISGDTPSLKVGSFVIEGFSPDEKLHTLQFKEGNKTSSFTVTNIAQKLSFVGRAVSDSKYKAALSGIYFDTARQQLAGADGSRLHVAPMTDSNRHDKCTPGGVIVPSSILKAARLLTGDGHILAENDADKHICFTLNVPGCTDCRAVYRTIDGQFPKYEDVIPREFANRFTARSQDILPILHRALIASATDSDSKPIIAEFRHGQMVITVNTKGRTTYRGIVQGQYNGAPYCGVVNVIFFLDAIQTSGDVVEILLPSEKDQAWTIKGKTGSCAVVMPIDYGEK